MGKVHVVNEYACTPDQLWAVTKDLDALREMNWVRLPISIDTPNRTLFAPFRENPEHSPLPTPSGKIEIFSETIDGFGYDDCPGHPVWIPPTEWLGAATREAPLHLVSPQPVTSCTASWKAPWRMSKGRGPKPW